MSFRKKLASQSASDKKEAASPPDKDMGYWEIFTNVKRLSKQTAVKAQIRNLKRVWMPLVSELETIVKQMKARHKEMLAPKTSAEQTALEDPLEDFLNTTDRMVTRATALTDSVSFDMYYVDNEKAALEMKVDNAVILFKDQSGAICARVTHGKQSVNRVLHSEQLNSLRKKIDKLYSKSTTTEINDKHEVIVTEKNIEIVDE